MIDLNKVIHEHEIKNHLERYCEAFLYDEDSKDDAFEDLIDLLLSVGTDIIRDQEEENDFEC